MSDESVMRDLFDRWERVWHEGQYDLIPSCVGQNYIRHDEKGDRTVTREDYAAEIAKTRQERPDTRFVVYDHSFEDVVPLYAQVDCSEDRRNAHSRGYAGLPDRGWEAREDMAHAATTGLGMARRHCAEALDELAANQVELLIDARYLPLASGGFGSKSDPSAGP
jgi:hypothetical protein